MGGSGTRQRIWSTALHAAGADYAPGDPLGPPLRLFRSAWRGWPWAPHTIADPFLLVRDDRLFLFAEVQWPRRAGSILAWSTRDLASFDWHGPVLEAPHHLSYPCVFEWRGEVWMIPESAQAGEIALYRFADFPRGLTRVRRLVEGAWLDTSPVFHDGLCYLFTSREDGLHLFVSDDLAAGEVRPHPLNPVVTDPERARCGGAPIRGRGGLVRLVQNGGRGYGEGLSAWKIDLLSPQAYHERLLCPDLLRPGAGWNARGGHHLSLARFHGGTIVAVDGQADEPLAAALAKLPAKAAFRRAGRS